MSKFKHIVHFKHLIHFLYLVRLIFVIISSCDQAESDKKDLSSCCELIPIFFAGQAKKNYLIFNNQLEKYI